MRETCGLGMGEKQGHKPDDNDDQGAPIPVLQVGQLLIEFGI
jgi:hypothetical protein